MIYTVKINYDVGLHHLAQRMICSCHQVFSQLCPTLCVTEFYFKTAHMTYIIHVNTIKLSMYMKVEQSKVLHEH